MSFLDPPTNQPTKVDSPRISEHTNLPPFTKLLSLDHLGGACRVGGRFWVPQNQGFLHGALPKGDSPHISVFFVFKDFIRKTLTEITWKIGEYIIYQEFCMFWRVWLLYMADIHRPKENTTIFEIEIRPVEVASSGTVSLHFHGISYSAKRKFHATSWWELLVASFFELHQCKAFTVVVLAAHPHKGQRFSCDEDSAVRMLGTPYVVHQKMWMWKRYAGMILVFCS